MVDVSTKKTFARGLQVRNTKMAAFPVYGETTSNTLVYPYKTSISISENFALNLLYIHAKVLAKNLFCIN